MLFLHSSILVFLIHSHPGILICCVSEMSTMHPFRFKSVFLGPSLNYLLGHLFLKNSLRKLLSYWKHNLNYFFLQNPEVFLFWNKQSQTSAFLGVCSNSPTRSFKGQIKYPAVKNSAWWVYFVDSPEQEIIRSHLNLTFTSTSQHWVVYI